MIFHHFLVMAAALVGRPALDQFAHHDVDLQNFATLSVLVKKLGVSYQKLLISSVLGESPKGTVKGACLDAFLLVFEPQSILFGIPVGPVNFLRAGQREQLILSRDRVVSRGRVYKQFGHLLLGKVVLKIIIKNHNKWRLQNAVKCGRIEQDITDRCKHPSL